MADVDELFIRSPRGSVGAEQGISNNARLRMFVRRIRAGGAGIPAFYTPVGFGTELAKGKEIRTFAGRDYVLEQAVKGDVALLRADTADRYGNLSFRYAQMNFGPVMAAAATLAVAEVRAVLDQPMPHERVQLPGVYVDRVVAVAA